ncbi:MAG: DUF1800 family protein [Candidatus Dormibacteraeota bacterium]|nr:DUF1800 family protein [Candidatus Dormibacteraeota bacterium]
MSVATGRLSRRSVLALGAGGVATAAGAGLLVAHLPDLLRPAPAAAQPTSGWASPLGTARGLAAHLLRRAGFGYTAAELDAAAALPYAQLVEHVLAQQPEPLPAVATPGPQRVVSAWYAHMATTTAQFPERMTLFWHGVLTSSFRSAAQLPIVAQQNALFRDRGRGDLRSLLLAVTYDPLMIRYLDLQQSTAAATNENYSRELMELFTLGPGNYTETDVREGARALSGIRMVLVDANGSPVPLARAGMTAQQYAAHIAQLVAQGATFKGILLRRQHDAGTKTFLGRSGNLGPEEVVDAILAQPACAQHVATRALTYFCSPAPSEALVTSVANAFRSSGYDVTAMMRAIFTSDDFVAAANYRSLVRSPADYMVAAMRALGRPQLAALATRSGPGMDQSLYDPPNVAGWPGNAGWVSSAAWLARVNFAERAVARGPMPDAQSALQTQLDGVLSDSTHAVLSRSASESDRWYALLASPEFNLK